MKIALIGDIALFGKNTITDVTYKERFKIIKDVFDDCDYIIGNLETPLTFNNRVIGGKSAYIKGNPNDVEILSYLGVTHVSLANNHMFDFGNQGIEDTLTVLEKNNIDWYGINNKKVIIEDSSSKVVLSGYCCYSTNGKGMGIVNIFDPSLIENELREDDNSLQILSLHWGQEHVHYPNYDHIQVSRKLCKDNNIVIHGHHPHVIQGLEEIDKSLVAYSLGNFCFDDVYTSKSVKPLIKLSIDNMESYILVLEIENSSIFNYYLIPFSFINGNYTIDNKIIDKIKKWSNFLDSNKEYYIKKRSEDLQLYYSGRKANRNLEWYLKRINFESARIILSARINKNKYNSIIRDYIS